jgi:hypothetical protein
MREFIWMLVVFIWLIVDFTGTISINTDDGNISVVRKDEPENKPKKEVDRNEIKSDW